LLRRALHFRFAERDEFRAATFSSRKRRRFAPGIGGMSSWCRSQAKAMSQSFARLVAATSRTMPAARMSAPTFQLAKIARAKTRRRSG
jgi:DNA-binding transcriptional regulator LsrR (DeoR family)